MMLNETYLMQPCSSFFLQSPIQDKSEPGKNSPLNHLGYTFENIQIHNL